MATCRSARPRAGLAGFLVMLVVSTAPATADAPLTVSVVNGSRTTICAEEDNVYAKLMSADVRRFRVTATLPSYIGDLAVDSTAPDFNQCEMSGDPRFEFVPRTVTLFEASDLKLVGHTFGSFWRPEVVSVSVGDREEKGLHLLQLLHRWQGRLIEVMVLYPADGYWRLKPMPPARWPDSAYGSSFLIGPVEEDGRPLVRIRRVVFEPAGRRFAIDFTRGGSASVSVIDILADRVVVDIALAPPVQADRPFAALRSMFVRPDIADVSEMQWRTAAAAPWQARAIMDWRREQLSEVRFARSAVSRHNSSAPDLTFHDFMR